MNQKISLQQKLQQRLSPQQIQLVQLLEVPNMELEQRIKKELEENPLLELDESDLNKLDSDDSINISSDNNGEGDDYTQSDITSEYKLYAHNRSADDVQSDYVMMYSESFHDRLLSQLRLLPVSDLDLKLLEYMLGNIDDDGYLRRDLYAISDDLAFNLNLDIEETKLQELLGFIQQLDPPGVGARNLQECMMLQLQRKKHSDIIACAMQIVEHYFELLSNHSYLKIQQNMHITEEKLKEVIDEIHKLNPRPGNTENDGVKNHLTVIPDFILEYHNGEMMLTLNDNHLPSLKVNEQYLSMMRQFQLNKKEDRKSAETFQFIKRNADNALWFIDAIKLRQITLLQCMSAIIEFQKDYFIEGDISLLKPMILKDIADATKLDISTISRIRQSKYIQTHFGLLSLKDFFSEGVEKDSGELSSNKVVMQLIREIIEQENKQNPLTDEKITELVNAHDYSINRRTVSKYREVMEIPVARLRRKL
ncbi:MAG: RNA polymerase factor sigma-54 [Mangrovibacterium sp.]